MNDMVGNGRQSTLEVDIRNSAEKKRLYLP